MQADLARDLQRQRLPDHIQLLQRSGARLIDATADKRQKLDDLRITYDGIREQVVECKTDYRGIETGRVAIELASNLHSLSFCSYIAPHTDAYRDAVAFLQALDDRYLSLGLADAPERIVSILVVGVGGLVMPLSRIQQLCRIALAYEAYPLVRAGSDWYSLCLLVPLPILADLAMYKQRIAAPAIGNN